MTNPFSYLKHHRFLMGGLVAVVVIATAIVSRLGGGVKNDNSGDALPRVVLAEAKSYLKDRGTISSNGTVESLEQAELRSQASGPVTKIYAQIGQKVSAGQALVSLQNSDIAAQLAQAQATLKAQEARLDELKSGARTEQVKLIETKVASLKQALEDTKKQQDVLVGNALSTLLNTGLAAIPDSGNSGGGNPVITGLYNGTEYGSYKITLYAAGDGLRFQISGLENSGGTVSTTPIPMGSKGLFIQFPSSSMPTNNSWTVSLPNTQSSSYSQVSNAYNSAVEARNSAINGASSALSAAQRELELTLAGASSQQIQAQEAAVEQAQANVRAISAQLDKTIIRSPINGTVSVLAVKYGELVSPGALVASVVNKGGLQVKSYISDYDMPYVSEGAEATINDAIKGKVARVSPSVDPRTKNVEINVAVSDPDSSGLVVGQNASVKISAKENSGSEGPVFLLPLQAVRITSGNASVFTVNQDSILEEKSVKLGNVSGEKVEIIGGLSADMKLVTTVYELKAGEKVSVENN